MGYKSRGNFAVTACFKNCTNRGTKCDDCVGGRLFKENGKKGLDKLSKAAIMTGRRNVVQQ